MLVEHGNINAQPLCRYNYVHVSIPHAFIYITCSDFAAQNHTEPTTHLFPFAGDLSSPLGALCQRVRKSMDNIHKGTGNIQDLFNIAQERYKLGTIVSLMLKVLFNAVKMLSYMYMCRAVHYFGYQMR